MTYVTFEKLLAQQQKQVTEKWHPLDQTQPPAAYEYQVDVAGNVRDRRELDPRATELQELRRLATVTPDKAMRKMYAQKMEALQKMGDVAHGGGIKKSDTPVCEVCGTPVDEEQDHCECGQSLVCSECWHDDDKRHQLKCRCGTRRNTTQDWTGKVAKGFDDPMFVKIETFVKKWQGDYDPKTMSALRQACINQDKQRAIGLLRFITNTGNTNTTEMTDEAHALLSSMGERAGSFSAKVTKADGKSQLQRISNQFKSKPHQAPRLICVDGVCDDEDHKVRATFSSQAEAEQALNQMGWNRSDYNKNVWLLLNVGVGKNRA